MYVWQPEHKAILEHIQATDTVNSEWPLLRDIIKYKIDQNTELFLASPERPNPPPPFQPEATASGGLKLAPFPPRKSIVPVPVNFMTPQEAAEMKQSVFELLDQFESNPPFTIQRVCELSLYPRRNYTSVGKYLRAMEKALLVTSTHDSFPPLTESEKDTTIRTMSSIGGNSVPPTPLFSPIPFLHDDARRSKSRSPPPSPLVLANSGENHPDPLETKALGLVDELDDPAPGHMSKHPVALTAVTTSDGDQFVDSLEARFVRAQDADAGGNDMSVDENKENTST
ncbi:PPP4R2-domain-containing protein [Mycena alexandri]|uniref:PPP4R2-domain-containing protein n=1 Tax=Mycena alexandri TaxID=1745969 RepID=A0AAD6XFV6_9AGAR|nr:PPP4R2-domain-containing protein [Mycena alexandri]